MLRASSFVTLVMVLAGVAKAAEPPADSSEFFEQKVRPVLIEQCFECHGNGQKKGGLSLDSAESLLAGGDSGPAIEAGEPGESLLIEAIGHAGDVKMPPDRKLSDREVADLTAWVRAGAVWPAVTVPVPLGNLFDDSIETSLGDALATDEFKAQAETSDLGVERIAKGWSDVIEISPGVQFSFGALGSSSHAHGAIVNDAWSEAGALRTLGQPLADPAMRQEQGIGMHANALITFDLIEIRRAGGLPPHQAFTFRSDRAGLNDDVFGSATASVHLAVLVTRTSPGGRSVTAVVNGRPISVVNREGVHSLEGELPPALRADGQFSSFEVPVPGDATALTLVATGAGAPEATPINSDHAVFSAARLELSTTSSTLAKLGRTDQSIKAYEISAEHRRFWSFQPIRSPDLPTVQQTGWPSRPLDRFVLAKLESQGLTPTGPATRPELIRRLTFDLIGLPPTPEEVSAFLADESPEAYERLVDRLLASPRFGERWARFWLDVARYGEDQAHTFQARMYPQGFRYRDWVVRAFNADLPYDRFVIEQIAGDQVEPLPDESPYDRLLALGYFALGPVYYRDAGCAAKAGLDELDDRVDTLARGFLGLTVACARCHDHKFDPIPQTDYYALAGIFQSSVYREAPLAPPEVIAEYDRAQAVVKEKEQAVTEFIEGKGRRKAEEQATQTAAYISAVWKLRHPPAGQAPKAADVARTLQLRDSVLERWVRFLAGSRFSELTEIRQALSLDPVEGKAPPEVTRTAEAFQAMLSEILAERDRLVREHAERLAAASDEEKPKVEPVALAREKADLLEGLFTGRGPFAVSRDQAEKSLDEPGKRELARLKKDVDAARQASPPMYPQAHSLADGAVADMKLHVRGHPQKTASEVPRGFLSILSPQPKTFSEGSGRLQLARAIASPENPLTARVIVNRIWQQHFGRGIVGTPSNFGQLGERPSHPELLDFLASGLIANGWSLKWLHREIVLSATWRQSAGVAGLSPEQARSNLEKDPENQWLWRMNRRRLDVEAWRDAMLAVSGTLDPALGGPSEDLGSTGNRRRTLYAKISRHNLDSLLRLFDFPDPNITSDRRTVTTVPLQQLFVLNSEFLVARAKSLAARLQAESSSDPERVRLAYQLLYGRLPHDAELAGALDYLAATTPEGSLSAWEQYAQVLLAASEFAFVD